MAESYEAAEKSAAFLGVNVNKRAAEASALSDVDFTTRMGWQSVASFSKLPNTKVLFRNNQSASSLASTTGIYAAASCIHRCRALMTRDWLYSAVQYISLYHNRFYGNSMS
jgi:hypothetical protein